MSFQLPCLVVLCWIVPVCSRRIVTVAEKEERQSAIHRRTQPLVQVTTAEDAGSMMETGSEENMDSTLHANKGQVKGIFSKGVTALAWLMLATPAAGYAIRHQPVLRPGQQLGLGHNIHSAPVIGQRYPPSVLLGNGSDAFNAGLKSRFPPGGGMPIPNPTSKHWDDSLYPYDPRIHQLGNHGALGRLHAELAPVFTKWSNEEVYGYDLRQSIVQSFGEDKKVLDMGCGTGASTSDNPDSLGIDTSIAMINKAKSNYTGKNFQVANMETFTPSQAFDIVTCMFCFHEIPQVHRQKIIEKAIEHADEKVVIVDIAPDYTPSKMMLQGEPYIEDYLDNVRDDLSSFGFEEVSLEEGHVHVWTYDKNPKKRPPLWASRVVPEPEISYVLAKAARDPHIRSVSQKDIGELDQQIEGLNAEVLRHMSHTAMANGSNGSLGEFEHDLAAGRRELNNWARIAGRRNAASFLDASISGEIHDASPCPSDLSCSWIARDLAKFGAMKGMEEIPEDRLPLDYNSGEITGYGDSDWNARVGQKITGDMEKLLSEMALREEAIGLGVPESKLQQGGEFDDFEMRMALYKDSMLSYRQGQRSTLQEMLLYYRR